MNQSGYTTEADRVRAHTSPEVNQQIDENIRRRVKTYRRSSRAEITKRIKELDREWDIERTLELNASAIALTGLLLGVTKSKKWLIAAGIVLPFLFQHAVQGWCPPLPLLRRLSFRSREEIDREKYALKALRGDFDDVDDPKAALEAART